MNTTSNAELGAIANDRDLNGRDGSPTTGPISRWQFAQLPVDHPRLAAAIERAHVQTDLPRELIRALGNCLAGIETTLEAGLFLAFHAFLHRYGNPEEFAVLWLDAPAATGLGRAQAVKVSYGSAPSFAMLTAELRRELQQLGPSTDDGAAGFIAISASLPPNQGAAPVVFCSAEPASAANSVASQVVISLRRQGEDVGLTWLYNQSAIEESTIRRWDRHFAHFIQQIADKPNEQIDRLSILPDAERRQIVYQWNATSTEFPRNCCIHQLFEAQVEKTPDAISVIFENESLTYRMLNARANQLARLLQQKGVGPGVLVGVCVERSANLVVAVLGILKAGGAYVPLDPSYPVDRLEYMINDAQTLVIVTQTSLCDRLPKTTATLVNIEAEAEAIAAQPTENTATTVGAEDRAYIIYTSGSTGKPKGVVLRHRPVVNTIDWVNKTFAVGPSDRLLFVTSVCFDLSVYDIFGSLAAGASLQVASLQDLRDPEQLLNMLSGGSITIWDSAPPMLQQLVPFMPGVRASAAQSRLRLVLLSGDWIPVPQPDAVRSVFTTAEVVSLGGATEAAIWSNYYRIGAVDRDWVSIPYGTPIQNARYHILDSHEEPVPIGVPGELYIGGECLADGYFNRPELTAERFVRDPLSTNPSDRLYRTGDLARYWADGTIEFLGRMDNQVKIRGYRIELGEIETALGQHPDVQECVVVARTDKVGDRFLVAFVVTRHHKALRPRLLRAFLQEKLPVYMVPFSYVLMDALPLNPNGKIDRKALMPPHQVAAETKDEIILPRDTVEEAIAGIWREVLGIESLGVNDDFFNLGGHSLKATQVVSRIRSQLQVDLPLAAFFKSPKIGALSTLVRNCAGGKEAGPLPGPVPIHGDRTRVPASFSQQRLWFIDQLGQDREVYNVCYGLDIRGLLSVDALKDALNSLAQRHESLRTTFGDDQGQPIQIVTPQVRIELPLIDLSILSSVERDAERRRLEIEDGRQIFDLSHGPLWKTKLIRLADDDHLLLLTMHHIITDGWSMWLLFRELRQMYSAIAGHDGSALPPLTIQYADYSQWQRERLQGALLASQLDYWKQRLAGSLPTLQMPFSRSRPKAQTFRGAIRSFQLPPALIEAAEALSAREGVTPYMTLFAAFKSLLYRYSNQEDIIVGTPIANRNLAEVEGVIGFFINTVAIRTDLAGDPSFRELVRRIRQGALGAFANQDIPFDMLVHELKPERDASYQPIFQVLFNYLHSAAQTARVGASTWTSRPIHNGTSKYDLTLFLEESPEGLQSYFEYNTDLFDADVIERMAGHFQTLLEGFVRDPDCRLSRLPLITEAERQRILNEWNNTRVDYPRDKRMHQLFEERAQLHPDRIAVVFDDNQLTYGDVNARANQLAHHLKTLGVGPDVMVGLCMERSAEMVIALLGILKAGGAYVPLDPAFPRDRLSYYAEDSKMPVLVTQQSLRDHISGHQAKVVCLDTDWHTIAKNPRDNPAVSSQPANLAYVIYTSGSTGKPKGVQVLQGALTNFVCSMRKQPGMNEEDVLLAVTTLSFDIHVMELWLPLTVGARVVIVSKEVASDGVKLLQRLNSTRITLLQATPATWRLLLAAGWEGSANLKIVCGGEPMTVELAHQLLPRVRELWNLYGPTETTVWSTAYLVKSVTGPIPIGWPIDNTFVYPLDRNLQLVPVGVAGELHIGGDGLARGYLNRPELTVEKFIPDPFQADPNARMYKTGDLAKFLPNGHLECLGRIDHQVKIRGYRIELGEIETVLGQHPDVRSAVVVARKEESGADFLAAYVIPQPEKHVADESLRKFLAGRLPEYMVPAHFVTLKEFPLTPNGKIDRKALPAPDRSQNGRQRTIVAGRNDAEKELLAIWEEVLKVKPISIHDNFFELGGHSFLAAVLVAKIKLQLGHSVPLGTLFAAPTVEKLAFMLQNNLEAGSASSLVAFNENGAKPALYMIAGVGGHVFTFHKFARLLGDEQPAYGVKAIGVDGVQKPPDRIEDIAAHYLKEILETRPHGPYVVGGYSIGAIVAYELAVQMRSQGLVVPMVVVFDMLAPGYPRPLPATHRLWLHAKKFVRLSGDEKKKYVVQRWGNLKARVLRKVGLNIYNAPDIKGVDALPQTSIKQVWVALQEAQRRYMPTKQYDGKILLFKAEKGFDWGAAVFDDPQLGWGRWCTGGIEDHTIPGAHLEMFSADNIGPVADLLKSSIDKLAAAATT